MLLTVSQPVCLSPDFYGNKEARGGRPQPSFPVRVEFSVMGSRRSVKSEDVGNRELAPGAAWPLCVAAQGCLTALTFPGGPHLIPGARRLRECPGQADAHSPSEPCLNTKSLQFLPSYRKKGCSVLAGCGVALGAGQGCVPPSEGRPLAHRADTPQKSRCCKTQNPGPSWSCVLSETRKENLGPGWVLAWDCGLGCVPGSGVSGGYGQTHGQGPKPCSVATAEPQKVLPARPSGSFYVRDRVSPQGSMTRYPVFAAGRLQSENVCTLTGPQPEVKQKALGKGQAEAPRWLSLGCQSPLFNPRVLGTHRGARRLQLQSTGMQGRLQGWRPPQRNEEGCQARG